MLHKDGEYDTNLGNSTTSSTQIHPANTLRVSRKDIKDVQATPNEQLQHSRAGQTEQSSTTKHSQQAA